MWVNAEGKRRKLALWNQYNRIIIGFTVDELSTLKENNFYTMIQQKYNQIIDELKDDITQKNKDTPYQDLLFESLIQMYNNGIIDHDTLSSAELSLEKKYGKISKPR